jgi:hypothetical protein
VVRKERDERAAALPPIPWWKRALWKSRVYRLVRTAIRPIVHGGPVSDPRNPDDLEHPSRLGINLRALADIRTEFPAIPITLAHFPQVEEIQAREYELNLAEATSELDVEYFAALTQCSWSEEMYHAVNRHPNERGYRNFADCLWRYLREGD